MAPSPHPRDVTHLVQLKEGRNMTQDPIRYAHHAPHLVTDTEDNSRRWRRATSVPYHNNTRPLAVPTYHGQTLNKAHHLHAPFQACHGCITGLTLAGLAPHGSRRRPPAPPHQETTLTTTTATLAYAYHGGSLLPPHRIPMIEDIPADLGRTRVTSLIHRDNNGQGRHMQPPGLLSLPTAQQSSGASMRTYPLPGWASRRIQGVHH